MNKINKISILLIVLSVVGCESQYIPQTQATQMQIDANISALELIKHDYGLDLSKVNVFYDTDLRLPCAVENQIYGCYRFEFNTIYILTRSDLDIIYTCAIAYHEYLHVVSHINNGDGDPEHKLMNYNSETIYDKCEAHLNIKGKL